MRYVALLVLVAGCSAGGDDYPIIPGGGNHTGSPMVDARVADGSSGDGGNLAGRVCLITDLRTPTAGCSQTGAAGITVQLGTSTATTLADGTFSIPPVPGTGLVWRISGADLAPSVIPFSTSTILPALGAQTYLDLKNANSVIENSGEGSVVLAIARGGAPLAGVNVTSDPVASYPALGDRPNATNWVPGATGTYGISWTPGIIAGPTRLTLVPPDGLDVVTVDVPIEDGAITFATVAIP